MDQQLQSLCESSSPTMDRQLQLLCERLSPPEEWLVLARKTIQCVFEHIKRNSKYKVDRCEIVGGVAKKTSTFIKADVDTIIYFNDERRDIKLTDVLSDWIDILLLNTDLREQDIHQTKKVLTFRYDGIPIDLVAVRNKANSTLCPDVTSMQQLSEINDTKRDGAWKDLTLSGPNVKWMKKKNKITHDIARLAKFWSQTVLFHYKVRGKSYIIEHIAVKAVEEVQEKTTNATPYVEAFAWFLEKVRDIRNLKLIFTDEYQVSDIPTSTIRQVPLLMDCVNPWNNLLDLPDKIKGKFFDTFSGCAAESINLLLKKQNISELFVPQPNLNDYPFKIIQPQNDSFLLGICDDNNLLPEREIRDTDITAEMKSSVDCILHVYAATLATLPKGLSSAEIQNKAGTLVNQMMNTNNTWSPSFSNQKHEDKQCTLRVPIGNGKAVCVSFDLDPRTK